jgi:XTP/dITP diphosphohydrolase
MLLVLATGNAKKGKELRELAAGRFDVATLADVGLAGLDIVEDGLTFAANAQIKCDAVWAALPPRDDVFAVLADDSGLIVDALDGKPGVRSARFAIDHGTGAGDAANNALLLLLLAPVPDERRTARFAAAIHARTKDGRVVTSYGTVEGRIARDERGAGGFGYDPLFVPLAVADGRRMSELSADEKHAISHRGKAMRDVLTSF